MNRQYHGLTIRDAAQWLKVSEGTVRKWFSRYGSDLNQARTGDGGIDIIALEEWVRATQGRRWKATQPLFGKTA